MKIVIAPDSFKENLDASDVALAIAGGVLQVCPDATLDLCPMADGGEGTVAAMVSATGGQIQTADVYGPLGQPVRAHFGLLGRGSETALPGELGLSGAIDRMHGQGEQTELPENPIAVIEMAAASGLALVPTNLRNPMRTTTFGTGQLILAALEAGASEIVLGIGGSATVDGGCGCAQALGVVFTAQDGEPCVCGLAGGMLAEICKIHIEDRDPRLNEIAIRVACDVTNPLTGPNGAAGIYGPQKGATPEMVEQLEAGLAHLAQLIGRDVGMDVETIPGAGAAGGLGAGLVAFAGAQLQRGIQIVADAVCLPRRLAGADLCITGEGKFDAQSSAGKTAVGVSAIAASAGVSTICIPGQADPDAPAELFAAVHPLVNENISTRQAMSQTAELLKTRAAEAMQEFLQSN